MVVVISFGWIIGLMGSPSPRLLLSSLLWFLAIDRRLVWSRTASTPDLGFVTSKAYVFGPTAMVQYIVLRRHLCHTHLLDTVTCFSGIGPPPDNVRLAPVIMCYSWVPCRRRTSALYGRREHHYLSRSSSGSLSRICVGVRTAGP